MARQASTRRWATARRQQFRPRPVAVDEEWWLKEGDCSEEDQWTGDLLKDFLSGKTTGDLSSDR